MITSLQRQNHTATSFWRNNDVISTPCVRWESVEDICCVLQACPSMAVWSILNFMTVMYFVCKQWHCQADVYHVGYLAFEPADRKDRFAAILMALEQYLKDHANDIILSKHIVLDS